MTPDRMRELADNLQSQIDNKFADRNTNTPRRQRQAASAALDGLHLERTQNALRWLADASEAGTVPACLANIRTKKALHDLTRAKINRSGGYYDAGFETGEPACDSEAAHVLWKALAANQEERRKAERLRRALDDARFAGIPGYFPTPASLAADIVATADIKPGDTVLEPSAGSGALLDAVLAATPAARITAYEVSPRLREVLELKGHGSALAGSDFMDAIPAQVFDRIVMNPPFENGQDLEHVRRAFGFLKPGGRLVAIMSGSTLSRTGRRWDDFRDWLECVDGYAETLPDGSFLKSGTSVAAIRIVVDAPAKVAKPSPTELTRCGLQYVIPGCEKRETETLAQMDLF
ncbi:methyltransferase [Stappia stellulata]|uniref:methyltransferase n=1 Tax=Stappia stellulata TaxID=71235 RepID=UPI001CD58CCF|nr:methyltransferase [Stappia stellulata]MCA1241858.1 methyltransferase [Stappia stellulata]